MEYSAGEHRALDSGRSPVGLHFGTKSVIDVPYLGLWDSLACKHRLVYNAVTGYKYSVAGDGILVQLGRGPCFVEDGQGSISISAAASVATLDIGPLISPLTKRDNVPGHKILG